MKRSTRQSTRRPLKRRVAPRRRVSHTVTREARPLTPEIQAPATEPETPPASAASEPQPAAVAIPPTAPQADTSAVTLPSPQPPARPPDGPLPLSRRIEEFLGFRLDNEEYCVWIRSIKEIIRPPEITSIPRSPSEIRGLISLRGTIVPIFDIRRRLGLPAGDMGPKSRIVVVVLDAGPVGMVVDHVTEVISVDADALEPPPPTMGEREATVVTATVRVRDRIIGVLHLDRLVAMNTDAPLRAVA